MGTVTVDHLRELWDAKFADEAVLALVDGELHVWTQVTAKEHGCRVVTTASDVWEYCDGEWDDTIGASLAEDLNDGLNR